MRHPKKALFPNRLISRVCTLILILCGLALPFPTGVIVSFKMQTAPAFSTLFVFPFAFTFPFLLFLQVMHSLFRELLSVHALQYILLSCPAIPNHDKQTGHSVASDRTTKNDRSNNKRTRMVRPAPGDSAERDLQ